MIVELFPKYQPGTKCMCLIIVILRLYGSCDAVLLYLLYLSSVKVCHVAGRRVLGMQGQKAYGLCTTPLCAVLVVQFFP